MIVKCEQCQTKFRVADEHVSEQGTLVRCSKCQHTFQVRRSAAAPAPRSASLADQLFGDLEHSDDSELPPELASPPPPPAEEPPPAQEADHSLFEMPPHPEPVSPVLRELLPPEEALLPPAPPKSRLLGPPQPLASPSRTSQRPSRSRVRRMVTGLLVNVVIAAGLLLVLGAVGNIYVNDGKLDASAFSIRRAAASLKASREGLAVESWNGIYDTKAGKPVFYIRGEAQNTAAGASKVRVRAEILDSGQLVRAAEVLAGAAATPEELYDIGSSEDADALTARLEAKAAVVSPGGRAPFLVTFYDYPPNLSAFRLKVTARALGAKETAAR
jgi:predicted Zn finger-like uncharacterized protein